MQAGRRWQAELDADAGSFHGRSHRRGKGRGLFAPPGKGACSPRGEGACSPDTEPHKAALTSGVWQPSSTRAPAPLKAPRNATHVDCLEGRSPRRENASPLTHSRAGRASANPPECAPPALQGEPLRALINSQPFHVLHQLCPHHLGVPYLEAERLVLLFAFFGTRQLSLVV